MENETVKKFESELEESVKSIDSSLLPLLRIYLQEFRDLRMSFGREVQDILRSAREVGSLVKQTEDIIRFATAIKLLQQTLTPEVLELMSKITRSKSEEESKNDA